MTARPYGIARLGRVRPAGFLAVAMVVLLLAATALFSAAAAHHASDPHVHAGGVAVAPVVVHDHNLAHEHQHGNGWAPHPTQRIRVLADAVVLAVASVVAGPSDQIAAVARADVDSPDSHLRLLGVLRV